MAFPSSFLICLGVKNACDHIQDVPINLGYMHNLKQTPRLTQYIIQDLKHECLKEKVLFPVLIYKKNPAMLHEME